jgi:hypothetical protein
VDYPISNYSQLLIDTEHKTYRNLNVKCIDNGSSGRGNNWAFGFNETSRLEDILDAYRKIMEQNIAHEGTMMINSIAGGTGSGLGSRLP